MAGIMALVIQILKLTDEKTTRLVQYLRGLTNILNKEEKNG